MSADVIELLPDQEAKAAELFERVRADLSGQEWAVIASVISNLMAGFALALRGPRGDVDPEAALE
ncbi:MAG TPA: hypothetical protein VLN57_00445, partial [Xanthobacteraceae bacterium]|nr:hypothetical protein [Xanthobacteraceae bacterium]